MEIILKLNLILIKNAEIFLSFNAKYTYILNHNFLQTTSFKRSLKRNIYVCVLKCLKRNAPQ